MGFAVDKETVPYQWAKAVMDAVLVGCGLLVTLGGVVMVVAETGGLGCVICVPYEEKQIA